MNLIFLNPWGLLGLLGIPAVLAIHFLQRQTRRIPVSTLFLIEQLSAQSLSGKRWEKLRQSVPLWLQLLCVLLLTLLLVQPRLVKEESVQRVVVILDNTWSMAAFRDKVLEQLPPYLERIGRNATTTEWMLLESDGNRGRLYTGEELAGLRKALDAWYPALPAHEFSPAWRLGLSLLQGQGSVLFVTDHPITAPRGIEVISYGEPIDNVGFTGFSTARTAEGDIEWTALVRNYSAQPVNTSWRIESGGSTSPDRPLQLGPGEVRSLKQTFPEELERMTLALEPDEFEPDNRLPIVRPSPRQLRLAIADDSPHQEFYQRIMEMLPATAQAPYNPFAEDGPDALLGNYNPLQPRDLPSYPGVFIVQEPSPGTEYNTDLIYAEEHPLTEYLSWQGLLVRRSLQIAPGPNDEVLVWQGNQPLIFLRPVEGRPSQLILNFDLRYSNAGRVPAVIVLVSRYLEGLRSGKRELYVDNVDTNQMLQLPTDPENREQVYVRAISGPAVPDDFQEFFAEQLSLVRAPRVPSFFEVRQGEEVLFRGAAQFVDSREADFSEAAPTENDALPQMLLEEREEQTESLSPVWLLALLGVLLGNWWAVWRAG